MGKEFTNDPYAELGVSSKKTGVHKATKLFSMLISIIFVLI